MNELCRLIGELAEYGVKTGLIPENERNYAINLLLDIFHEDAYEANETKGEELEDILKGLLDIAVDKGLIEDSIVNRDLFDTRLMNAITPRPGEVIRKYQELFARSPKDATDWFYKFCGDSDYIRRYRAKKDVKWTVDTDFGVLDITINLAKPEKDPKAIAAAAKMAQSSYPKCQLCVENMGYAGRLNHPARQTLRIMPITINGSEWGFQYSPYGYYNEHCILLNGEHVPMAINEDCFKKMFDFISQYPHYMIGSNADLPIVGGSILSHDHYQGGNYEFAMAKAPIEKAFKFKGFEDVEAGIVKWPMSVIRLRCADHKRLTQLSSKILAAWRAYTDEAAFVFAETDGVPHNTITPIARKKGDSFEIDLVLRNNITTDEHPMGVYHPHKQYHHIKKENIGLIEVMGLAILPSRLVSELEAVKNAILNNDDLRASELTASHADWVEEFLPTHPEFNADNAMDIIKEETGKVFLHVLEDAGVYKCTPEGREAFMRFLESV
ncbi:UDP-glucose--hexose-1-phosphate uridylyltransferase [Lacrimispora saccharolytica]|uniref:UDP-glucose--hexose-1-phosphate uridylyltransferase n=1 Tax=Lacrimispora saccharolytica TaxID=84030 RepID=UPI00265D02D2|nr:UDP-glucose--hexose-1-phosphate uridylyltransferase [Lacrimispora saccharolytica]MCF2655664.1 UDP-glucose--hexose-1-phosphate uridylyltransferase [Lacrimispora saccharolytica]